MNEINPGLNEPYLEFEYYKLIKEVDECDNIELLRGLCKGYIAVYLKQKELTQKMLEPYVNEPWNGRGNSSWLNKKVML